MDVGISLPPLVTAANTEIARLAGCSQLGQSAPTALIDCSFSNLWLQVGQIYSYRGMLPPHLFASGNYQVRSRPEITELNLTERNMKRQGHHHR